MLHWMEDFSHVRQSNIEKGLELLDLYQLRIDRRYSEEEKAANRRIANALDPDRVNTPAWIEYCETERCRMAMKITRLCDFLDGKFNIYQYRNDKINFCLGEWDLFFWCNSLFNTTSGKYLGRDMSYVTLTFNSEMTIAEKFKVLDAIKDCLNGYQEENIAITIQYSSEVNEELCRQKAETIYNRIGGKIMETPWGKGKIMKDDHSKEYRFFRYRARRRYTPLSPLEICGLDAEKTDG